MRTLRAHKIPTTYEASLIAATVAQWQAHDVQMAQTSVDRLGTLFKGVPFRLSTSGSTSGVVSGRDMYLMKTAISIAH